MNFTFVETGFIYNYPSYKPRHRHRMYSCRASHQVLALHLELSNTNSDLMRPAGTPKTCSVQIILQVQNLSSSGIKQAGTELMTVTDSEALNNHKIGFYELLIQANGLPTFMLYPSGTAAPQPSW